MSIGGSLWVLLVAAAVCLPDAAFAYVGPGAGLGAIGTLVALVTAVLLAIVGFVWYPIKRLLRQRRATAEAGGDGGGPAD